MGSKLYAGNGFYQDPSGALLPLTVASLDRIDCSRPYDTDNVRLLYLGLNLLRNDGLDDEATVLPYLRSLKGTWSEARYGAEPANITLSSSWQIRPWKSRSIWQPW